MKKTFKLTAENKNPQRVLEGIKNEIRKYIKREKRKLLPEGMDLWYIDCKFAQNDETPKEIALGDITRCLDEAAKENCESIYIELLSKGVKKEVKPNESESVESK